MNQRAQELHLETRVRLVAGRHSLEFAATKPCRGRELNPYDPKVTRS